MASDNHKMAKIQTVKSVGTIDKGIDDFFLQNYNP